MDTMDLLILVATGILAGWLASRIVGGKGLLRYLIAGLLGAVVGNIIVSYFGLTIPIDYPWLRTFLVATGGAIIVIVVARLVA